MHILPRWLAILLSVLFLAPIAPATWSIIIVDTRTGEIAIGSATCLTSFDLKLGASVVVVGKGAGAAQSFVDTTGRNRQLIFQQLMMGTAPSQILVLLAQQDPQHQTRQYGIVDVQGRAVGFTGTGAGAWAGHLTGQVGTLVYAIQGNVLTGQPVLLQAEQAVRNTPGDLAEKLMAGMEAARLMGGDGRCSCSTGPTACGSPPPSFTKSAHIGYMVVARIGDVDGTCSAATGCANGSYYLDLNVANQRLQDPDPVLQLRTMFLNWRLQKLLVPDHYLSSVQLEPPDLPADGRTTATARVVLRDWRGVALGRGGALVQVALDPAGTASVQIGSVTDHNDGTYSFPVTAGNTAGSAILRVTVDDGSGPVLLWPPTEVEVLGDALWASRREVSAAAGGAVDFVLNGGAGLAGRTYLLLASNSGTSPGIPLSPSLVLPLNPDPLLFLSLQMAVQGSLPGFFSTLDPTGWRSATLNVPPGLLGPLQSSDLSFAWGTLNPIDFTSNPVDVHVGQ